MANRNFANSRIYTGHVMPVALDCHFNVGASGAVSSMKGAYITSVTRLGVGKYKIKANDPYNNFYMMRSMIQSPSSGTQSGVFSIELDSAPSLNPASPGAEFIIQCYDAAGAAKEIANGSKLYLEFYLSNSSVLIGGE